MLVSSLSQLRKWWTTFSFIALWPKQFGIHFLVALTLVGFFLSLSEIFSSLKFGSGSSKRKLLWRPSLFASIWSFFFFFLVSLFLVFFPSSLHNLTCAFSLYFILNLYYSNLSPKSCTSSDQNCNTWVVCIHRCTWPNQFIEG